MYQVLDEVDQHGVTQEEVERARQQMLKDRELAAADPNRIAVALSELGRAGRLAALLPRPRPAREGDARGGEGSRRAST